MSKEKTPDRLPPTNKTGGRKKKITQKKSRVKSTKKSTTNKTPQVKKCGRCNKIKDKRRKDHCKCGRPTKMDLVVVRKLIEIFRVDGTVTEACAYAKISRETYYHWIDKDIEFSDISGKIVSFREEMEQAQNYAFIVAKKTLVKSASKDPRSAIEFLKRRHSDYKDKQEHTINETIINEDDLIDD